MSTLGRKEGAMKLLISILAAAVMVAGSVLPARATDDTKVKAATEQVQSGARKIGDGKIGPGFEETAKGVGRTVVEGAKYSGQAIKDFFSRAFGS
jgi:uncharacterized cupredoxin-like copper-binding protein